MSRTLNAAALAAAADRLAQLDPTCWLDQASGFTCDEAEAIAQMLAVIHEADTAEAFLSAHAAGDDEGDSHFQLAS